MFNIKDKEILVKGAVLAMLADTQAAHSIGGFKIGVGWSLRKCRNCLATKETMSVQVSKCCLTYNGKVYNTSVQNNRQTLDNFQPITLIDRS